MRTCYPDDLFCLVIKADRSENSDATPVVVRIRQQEEHLPDFGGQSPIRKETEQEDDRRPHGRLTKSVAGTTLLVNYRKVP